MAFGIIEFAEFHWAWLAYTSNLRHCYMVILFILMLFEKQVQESPDYCVLECIEYSTFGKDCLIVQMCMHCIFPLRMSQNNDQVHAFHLFSLLL